MSVKIKLCGMFRECDIDYANEAMPDYIGFIINFPKSHRNIAPEFARRLRARLDSRIKAVGVFVNSPYRLCAELANSGAVDIIQLHGNEDAEYTAKLRELTSAPIIKAVKVTSFDDIINSQALDADFLLFDSGTGSGKPFDHSLIDRERITKPFFMAGGLTPDNLTKVIREIRPFAVDLSSGIETEKLKDREKMLLAVKTVRELVV